MKTKRIKNITFGMEYNQPFKAGKGYSPSPHMKRMKGGKYCNGKEKEKES